MGRVSRGGSDGCAWGRDARGDAAARVCGENAADVHGLDAPADSTGWAAGGSGDGAAGAGISDLAVDAGVVGFHDEPGDQRGAVFLQERVAARVGLRDSLSARAVPGPLHDITIMKQSMSPKRTTAPTRRNISFRLLRLRIQSLFAKSRDRMLPLS